MLDEANRRGADSPDLPVEFRVGDLRALDLPDESFDATRAKMVLGHCEDVPAAVGELIRVTRVGGRVAAFEYDYETLFVDHPDPAATRAVVRCWADGHRNGWIGRQVARHFRERGLRDVAVSPYTVVMPFSFFWTAVGGNLTRAREAGTLDLSAAALDAWWDALLAAEEGGRFLGGQTGFLVAATR